jgi:hypothetical protein
VCAENTNKVTIATKQVDNTFDPVGHDFYPIRIEFGISNAAGAKPHIRRLPWLYEVGSDDISQKKPREHVFKYINGTFCVLNRLAIAAFRGAVGQSR